MVAAIEIRTVDIAISIVIDHVLTDLNARADTERVGVAVIVKTIDISVKVVISIVVTDLGNRTITERAIGTFGIGAIGLPVPIIIDPIATVLRPRLRIFFHTEASIGRRWSGGRSGRGIVQIITSSLSWISPPPFRESVNKTPLRIGNRSVKINGRAGASRQAAGIASPLIMRPQFCSSIPEVAQRDHLGITFRPSRTLRRAPEGDQHDIIDSAIGLPRNESHRIRRLAPDPPGTQGGAIERADRLLGPALSVRHEMGEKYVAPVSDYRDQGRRWNLGG